MTLALQAAAAPSISRSIRNPTLREALADAGVKVIPIEMVRAYKREMAKDEWGSLEPLITFADRLLWIPRLYFVTRFIEWATGRHLGPVHASMVVGMFIYGGVGQMSGGTNYWLLMVPLLASIPSMLAYFVSYYGHENRWREMGSWRHAVATRTTYTVGTSISNGPRELAKPPARLRERASRALRTGRARVLVEYRGSDPFLVVVGRLNPFNRHYIGAWDTYDSTLNGY